MDAVVLMEYGVDVKAGTARFFDDEEMFRSVLALFPNDDAFTRAKEAFELGDTQALLKCVHELKGVSGNASLTALHAACDALVSYIRGGGGDPTEVNALFAAIEAAYSRAAEGVALALLQGCGQ